ncbi:MAG: LytTR family DNA-binding domain-containing protein [Bacteroidota bacterium]|nr:LytTR family DNA-binding domain-containing protein [Bacteroidota bacterium]
MKVVIIEDEQLAARRLESMIRAIDSNVEVLAKLESVEDSVEWFRTNTHPDLIFLDIHLEDDLCFSIFNKVKITTPVIFTTAFDEYAIKAFKLKSIDYLLKPIVHDDLNAAICKYKDWNSAQEQAVDVKSLMSLLTSKTTHYRERFSVTIGQKIKTINTADIAYFYSAEGVTFMVLNDKHEYPLDYSLDKLFEEVDPKQFFRINRQYMVRLTAIANVHVFPKSRLKLELLPRPSIEIFVSLDKVTAFKRWLDGESHE